MTKREKKELIKYLKSKEGEALCLCNFALHMGRAPRNLREARRHVCRCGWCLYRTALYKSAEENKIFVNIV